MGWSAPRDSGRMAVAGEGIRTMRSCNEPRALARRMGERAALGVLRDPGTRRKPALTRKTESLVGGDILYSPGERRPFRFCENHEK
jgi:hypothetical protein